MNYNIRLAITDDIPNILSINLSASAILTDTEHAPEINARLLKNELLLQACNEKNIWVAVDNKNEMVGYGLVSKAGSHAYINDISVAPDSVRQGIARSIANIIYNWAIENELESVSSSTYRDFIPGLMFFHDLGYSILSENTLDNDLSIIRDSESRSGLNVANRTFLSIKTGVSKQSGKNIIRQAINSDIGSLTSIRHKTTETQIRIFSKDAFPGNFHYRPLHQLLIAGQLFTATDKEGNVVGLSVVELYSNCLHISEIAVISNEDESEVTKNLVTAALKGAKLAELPAITIATFQLLNRQCNVLRALGFSQLSEDQAPPEIRGIVGREKHDTNINGRVYFWINLTDHRKTL